MTVEVLDPIDRLPISRKQALSVGLAQADAAKSQMNLWEGAVRSGKTVGSLFAYMMKMAKGTGEGEAVIIGRTRDTAYRNLISPLQNVTMFGDWASQVKYNRGAPTAEILGRTVHVLGSSDVRSEGIIRGMTIEISYCDEITLMAEEFVNQLMARHSVDNAWMGATTNPDGPRHFLKKDYIDRRHERGHRVFHFELEDNRRYLPDGYIENLSQQYTGLWNDRFIKGLWTMADGVIYDMFDPALHAVDRLPDMQQLLCIGIDDGVNHPAAGILLGLGVDNRLYAMAEFAPPAGTPADRARLLRRFEAEHGDVPYHFVDPSAAALKMQLTREGFPGVVNASNNHKLGIGMVASLLSTQQLLIHSSCTNLLNEIPGYVWDSKAVERGEDKPVKENDDFADALRYAVASSQFLWRYAVPLPDDHRFDSEDIAA
ncbi:terminase large subunit domain-containing protein [Rhodococcus sp. Chr-9]|uniref:terminase large subunit domain-containing protein n=1 Tax=Rhodococcus sp. Chr-9 TaxID=713612 RepID=UPI000AFA4B38|nr:terminase family protein [Rhodococcus sp. Chr-9]